MASLSQFDFGFFLQDDWRLRPNFTLSAGFRYETQTHLHDGSDLAPRLGFAWGVGNLKGKSPKNVIRGGFGMFYDRFSESLTLDAQRLDGIRQQQFLIPFPNFYPNIPSVDNLLAGRQAQVIRKIDSQLHAPTMIQGALGFERQLPRGVTVSTNYIHTQGVHALRSRNINAPVAGNFPYGNTNGIYLYEASGVYRQNQIITNLNARINPKLTFTTSYSWNSARSNTDGPATFPANQYDLTSEFGRANYDIRHRFQLNGSVAVPWGLRLSPFVTATSGRPYNVTLGRDLNGDSLFTDRPAFATDLSHASVVRTIYGVFDLAPLPRQTIIPRNYLDGPGLISANLRVSKTFTLGPKESGAKKPSADPKQLVFTFSARNILNHPNLGAPDGNLSSPVFGHSTGLVSGVGGGAAGNRRIDLQMRFNF